MGRFSYSEAFSRNLGWVSEGEFNRIPTFRIAIAGMGGVGGNHLITLVRMGFCKFVISDPDTFELVNFNRQHGATMDSLGRNKAEVMRELALKINPEAEIEILPGGVTADNMGAFLADVDLYVDGLDVFEINIRRQIFRSARERGIPAVTSAPIGFGATSLVFTKDSMSFEDYFNFKDGEDFDNLLKFVVGLAPSLMHLKYLADRKYSDLASKRTSSSPAGISASAAIVCAEAVKILLGRGPIQGAPHVHHHDFFLMKSKKSYHWLGNRNPFTKFKLWLFKRLMSRISKSAPVLGKLSMAKR